MITWDDRSNAIAERYVCQLGALTLSLYREHGQRAWWTDVQAPSQVCASRFGLTLVSLADADAAKARALALIKPTVDALAEQAAIVARDVAVAVAGARLDGVG